VTPDVVGKNQKCREIDNGFNIVCKYNPDIAAHPWSSKTMILQTDYRLCPRPGKLLTDAKVFQEPLNV